MPVASAGLGQKVDVVGHSGVGEPLRVGGPGLREVELAVDQGVPAGCGVGQVDRDLGVLDPPGGAGCRVY
jgi:hypothetical protein